MVPPASARPLPTLIMEEIKNRVLGSPLPSRSDTDSVCIELMPLGDFNTSVLHLDVEERSEELLAPALLCHKEPARASKAPY